MGEILESLRQEAIFFKVESAKKLAGAVSAIDVLKILKSLVDSYNSYIEIEYDKINTQADKSKLKKIRTNLHSENELLIVDLKFESYGMAVSPNTSFFNKEVPNIKKPITWKKQKFEEFKEDFITANYNSNYYLKRIQEKYSEGERVRIFKPLFDGIFLNESSKVSFRIGEDSKLKKFNKPKKTSVDILIPETVKLLPTEEPTKKTSMALVEIVSGRLRPKVLELFDQIERPVFPFQKIEHDSNTYQLKYPLYCEISHEEDHYVLENQQIGIYAFGQTLDEAKMAFCEEFDYMYNRYNSLENENLTTDVIEIKNFINSLI